MKITVFGLGYVGCVSLACLARDGHEVVGVDLNPDKISRINRGEATIVEKGIDQILADAHAAGRVSATDAAHSALKDSQASIICVGTPNRRSGHLEMQAIHKVAHEIGSHLDDAAPGHVVLIRSTVLPGTNAQVTEILRKASGDPQAFGAEVVSNPEFLRESTAVHDFYNPPVTVIGTSSEAAFRTAREVYGSVDAPVQHTSVGVAEMIKLVNNSWHALKVAFANEVGVIAKELGVDSHALMELFCQDTKLNISPYYLRPGFSYGGSCLPKDLRALRTISHDHYLQTPVLDSISASNDVHTRRLVELIENSPGNRVGILGLSFKAGTDDLRNSPIVEVAETLLGRGYEISIFDKNVRVSQLMGQNRSYIDEHIPHLGRLIREDLDEVIQEADILVIANPEDEFREISDRCDGKRVLDLVRLWPRSQEANADYEGIVW